ncbi:Uncharacterised protein [Serratia odorifera]|uniref:Uncharacterized protein n=1 Tax=Serratia odorifera TaxID=618 RepID=A0A3S4HH66_SEROD|nr:Uncharacterised protein [Serratia odorifera]
MAVVLMFHSQLTVISPCAVFFILSWAAVPPWGWFHQRVAEEQTLAGVTRNSPNILNIR